MNLHGAATLTMRINSGRFQFVRIHLGDRIEIGRITSIKVKKQQRVEFVLMVDFEYPKHDPLNTVVKMAFKFNLDPVQAFIDNGSSINFQALQYVTNAKKYGYSNVTLAQGPLG